MPRVASPPLPEGVTAGQMARAAGVSERVILGRKSDGRLPVRPDGSIDLHAVIKAGITALAADAKGADASALDRARVEVLNEQRDKLRLVNSQLRGDSVLAEDLEVVVGALCDAVRAKMLALPSRAAPELFGLATPQDVRDRLQELCHDACSDLAGAEVVSTVKDRARRRAGRGDGGDAADAEAGATA